MNVRFVGVENALSVHQTHAGHAHKIENRHGQQGDHDHHAVRARSQHRGIVHGILDREVRQGVAQHQTAGVAHERLGAPTFGAEHVEEEKRSYRADQPQRDQGVGLHAQLPEQSRKGRERQHRKSTRKSVDAINEVHRVDNEQTHKHRQRTARPKRNFPKAKQAIEIVDVQTAQGHEGRRSHLHRKLHTRAESQQIIEHADEINEKQSRHDDHRRKAKDRQLRTLYTDSQIEKTRHNADGHGRRKQQTAQTGDLVVMHLPLVGLIVKPLLAAELNEPRHEQRRESKTHDESDD